MFNKNKFAQILKNISETYNNQRDFSKKSEINRTYLSQYMNMKLNKPPKPEILEKLANSSHGTITYEELMNVCGYLSSNSNKELLSLYNELNDLEKKYSDRKDNLSIKEIQISSDLFDQVLMFLCDGHTTPETFNPNDILNDLDFISNRSKVKLYKYLKECFEYFYKKDRIEKRISDIECNKHLEEDLILKNLSSEEFQNKAQKIEDYMNKNNIPVLYNIPILGKIAAGQPILADQYIEGYLPMDPNIYGMTTPNDYFCLRVTGESMNLKIHNGDYALIHKQDTAEDGDIVVAIVNGDDEATLKKYKRISNETVALEPMSTLPMEPIYVNLKETNFKIIGKAIGQFGKF